MNLISQMSLETYFTVVAVRVLLKVVLIVVLAFCYLTDADGIHSILMDYVDIIQYLD